MLRGATGFTSYHNHPGYCDGSGTVAEYAEAALAAGLTGLGLSSHAPVPFACTWTMPLARLPDYISEVRAAQAAYRDRLPIALGLELDYLHPDVAPDAAAFQAEQILAHGLDYLVASVHFVGHTADGEPWAVDAPGDSFDRQLRTIYGGDVRRLVTDYYERVAAMAAVAPGWGPPVVVGHIDKVKMWNVEGRYFDEMAGWYLALVDEALAAVARAGLVVEINTAGLGRPHGEPYPGPAVLW
jgi:histidinol-phosphatase (PHP family)